VIFKTLDQLYQIGIWIFKPGTNFAKLWYCQTLILPKTRQPVYPIRLAGFGRFPVIYTAGHCPDDLDNFEEQKMKRLIAAVLAGVLFVFAGCDTAFNSNGSKDTAQLADYENAGRTVAKKPSSQNYDCSNYSTQFYQNCYKAGLSCRIKVGVAGGNNVPHAWNSVKIDGVWLDWEPQLNSVHSGHTQTSTPTPVWGDSVTNEDITRMMYELVGRKVPERIIDDYEIDTHLVRNSPFNKYFDGYCLSDDPAYNALVKMLQSVIPNNGDGTITVSPKGFHVLFMYKQNDKCYGIDGLEKNDPVEGRSFTGGNRLKLDFTSTTATEFIWPEEFARINAHGTCHHFW
jgi:hypothetical protein